MRILSFLPDLGGGGAQRTLVNLAGAFHHAGHDVVLAAAQPDGPARAWVDPGVTVAPVGRGQLRHSLFALTRLIRDRRPDVILSSVLDANVVAAAARLLAGRPRPVLVVRETNSHRARGDIGMLRRSLAGIAYRHADAVVGLSEGVSQELIADYRLDRSDVVTIHNPVAFDALAAEAKRSVTPPVEKTARWIMGVGRFVRQKGFDRLIDAVASMQRSNTQLVLVGDGPDRAALAKQAADLGVPLLMPGFVQEPMQWLAHADVFVLSSRWEGFGHVIVEAMAAGAPVVAFDCPHGPRDIIDQRNNGILVPNNDERGLVKAIVEVLDDREFSAALRRRGLKDGARFSSTRIADAYLDLFARLVRRHGQA